MTIRKLLEEKLCENGLWPAEATKIITELEGEKSSAAMAGRWDEDSSAYPEALLSVLWVSARSQAALWLEKNNPRHWARPMFDDKMMAGIKDKGAGAPK